MPHYYYYVVDCWLLYARICHSDMFSNRSEKSDTNPLIWQFSWSEMVDGHFRSTFYAKLENKKIDTIQRKSVAIRWLINAIPWYVNRVYTFCDEL